MMDTEVARVERRSRGTLSTTDAGAVEAFLAGALVFGAFAPCRSMRASGSSLDARGGKPVSLGGKSAPRSFADFAPLGRISGLVQGLQSR